MVDVTNGRTYGTSTNPDRVHEKWTAGKELNVEPTDSPKKNHAAQCCSGGVADRQRLYRRQLRVRHRRRGGRSAHRPAGGAPTLEACQSSLTSTGVVIRSNITEPLVERDADTGELGPKLATEWEQTSDETWTFTLREGVTFTDGTPFDAEAAAFTIDRAVNSDLGCEVEGYVFFGDTDLDVKVVDDTTLTVTTPEPDPILPLRLSFVEMVSPKTSTTEKVRVPIGTGPYEVADWQAGQRLSLDVNPNYWGDAPGYQSVNYVWRAEGSVRAAMVTNGEADIATSLAPEDGAGELAVAYRNNETTALRIQSDEPPLDDIRIRQAVNSVIDRNTLVQTLFFENLATPAGELIPEASSATIRTRRSGPTRLPRRSVWWTRPGPTGSRSTPRSG